MILRGDDVFAYGSGYLIVHLKPFIFIAKRELKAEPPCNKIQTTI